MTTLYDLQAHRIETVLAAQRVPARVWQVELTRRYVRFDLTVTADTRLSKLSNLDEEIAFALGAPAARIYREAGVLHIEIERPNPRAVTLASSFGQVPTLPPNTALLGERSDGAPLLVRIDSPDIAHVLISGATGSGKSILLRALLLSLAMANHQGTLQLVLIDPKGPAGALAPLASLPHAWRSLPVISTPADAALALQALVIEMERRTEERRNLPRLIIAIDELADLIATAGRAITDPLERLTQRGREPGLHLVAATQRPAATLVGGMTKANFPARLVGSVTSTDDAKVAAGIGGTGAERLAGRGDFMLIARGQQIRFQAIHTTADQAQALAGALWQNGRRKRSWSESAVEQALANPVALPPAAERTVDVTAALGGVGGWVGLSPHGETATASEISRALIPTPPHPPTRRTLRDRFSDAQLRAAFTAAGGNRKAACSALFGYHDSATLALLRQAVPESMHLEGV